MSHGSSEGDLEEPNLTPLLDLVLQLVMFFMLCANFVMEQFKQGITLPESITAKPIDKEKVESVVFNIDKEGNVDAPGRDALNSELLVLQYLKDVYVHVDERMKAEKKGRTAKDVTVVIRADKDTPFSKVHEVMNAAKTAGFAKFNLRAVLPKKE